MNFLVEFTTRNYKVRNSMAIRLKELYPGSKFGGIISAHGDIKKYLESQKEVDYEFLYDITYIQEEFLKEDVPIEEIKIFEESIPEKSLWRFIAIDRKWGYQFIKGSLTAPYYSNKEINCEDIQRIVGGYIRFYKKVLSEFNTDVVIFMLGVHSVQAPIFEQVCKNMKVAYISPAVTKIQNYFSITSNKEMLFPQIKDTYLKSIQGELVIDPSPGEKSYEEMHSSLMNQNSTYYFDQGDNYVKKLKASKKFSFIHMVLRCIASTYLGWYRMRTSEKQKAGKGIRFSFKYLPYYIYYNLYRACQGRKLFENSFYDTHNPNEKYIYFPLHVVPEYTLLVRGNMWINQLFIIENLAKSIPLDYKVYVKEHPANIGWRVRPFSFYKEIKSYTNVKLIPTYLDNNLMIKNSQLVITVTGTAGWEAVLFHNKPVINLCEDFYDISGLSKRIHNMVDLSKEIQSEIKRISGISMEERKKRLVYLINAIIINSSWADEPLTVLGEEGPPASEKEVMDSGTLLGNEIGKYLDRFQN